MISGTPALKHFRIFAYHPDNKLILANIVIVHYAMPSGLVVLHYAHYHNVLHEVLTAGISAEKLPGGAFAEDYRQH